MLIAKAGVLLLGAALSAYEGYVKRCPVEIAVALLWAVVAGVCLEGAVLGA